MKIDAAVVRHMAQLAELAVAGDDVPLLATQLEAIVNLVAQLSDVPVESGDAVAIVGPARFALRADVVDPIPLVHPVADIAPVFERGFFVVPRLGGMAEE